MSDHDMTLRAYSDYTLIRELERRLESREVVAPTVFCQDCIFFKAVKSDKANPCARGHRMDFKMPEDYDFDNSGFFRLDCQDFEAKPEAVVDPEAPKPSPRPAPSKPVGVKRP